MQTQIGQNTGSAVYCQQPRRQIPYTPFPSQWLFSALKTRFRGFSGPVGSGKTMAIAQNAIRLAYANAGRVGIVGAPTFRMLADVTRATILEILGGNKVPHSFRKSDNEVFLKECGSTMRFRSLDDPTHLVGPNIAWFAVDELSYCQEDSWRRLEARLRDPKAKELAGIAGWTPNGRNWTWQRFISSEKIGGYGVVLAKAFENRVVLARTPDYYERLKASYDERFYQQEVLGLYLSAFAGNAYYAFDTSRNVAHVKYDPQFPVCWTMDFNIAPLSSLICQLVPTDLRCTQFRLNVLEEISLPASYTPDSCVEFARRTGSWIPRGGRLQVQVYGDPAGNARHTAAAGTDFDAVRDFFAVHPEYEVSAWCVPDSHPPVKDRVNIVNAILQNARGESRCMIDPSCRELIKDLERVTFKADTHGVITNNLDKSDPQRTHMSDALGYLAWDEFRVNRQGGYMPGLLF
jgi:hypothetical protein